MSTKTNRYNVCKKHPSQVRARMLSTLSASCFLGLSATTLFAQEPAGNPESIEEITVVGSQIRGARITGALPVTVVNSDDIANAAAVSGDDLFRSIPSAGDITFNGTYLGGGNSNAARGDVSTVSLRGLAQGNTLLLLNGRRSVIHPTSQTDNETPVFGYNVNAIPVSGIERVEVLKDGAAALYGSDAVAGVVNNVLRSDFEGLEIDFQYGSAEGDEWTGNMVFGTDFAQGRGNISFFLGASEKDAVLAADQEYTSTLDRRPLVAGTSFEGSVAFDGRSTTNAWGGFQALGAGTQIRSNGAPVTDVAGNFLVQPTSISGCTYALGNDICYASGAVTAASKREMRADSRRIEGLGILPAVERYNAFTFLNYELTENLTFFGELGAYQATTNVLSTQPASLASTPINIPATAYWNPFGPVGSPNRLPGLNIPASGLPVQIRNYLFSDSGPRLIEVENDQYRILGGLRGDIGAWSWESALLYNTSNVKDTQDHFSSTATQQALARTTPDAYNPFLGGDPFDMGNPMPGTSNNAATIDSMRIKAVRENEATLSLWDLKVSRSDLFSLPAGFIGMAGGIEYRRETYADNRDTRQDQSTTFTDIVTGTVYGSDLMGHSPSPDVKGDRNVMSAFIEFAVPVVSPEMNVPLVNAFDLQFAGRYEDYNDVGSVAKPKVAASWDVVEGLRLRSSWSQGFKAPNLEVINTPLLERLLGRTDYIKCEADLRAGRIDSYSRCTHSYGVASLRQGNQNLVPEESESFSYGLVFEPAFIPAQYGSFVLTVDSWRIAQTGVIGVLDDQSAMNLDYLLRLQGSVNPLVVRRTPTPAEVLAFAGSGLDPAGEVVNVNAAFTNLLPITVAGVDFGLVYDNDFDSFGSLRINLNATKLNKFFKEPSGEQQRVIDAKAAGEINQGVPVVGAADLIANAGNPKWKGTLSVTWSLNQVQVGYMTQYTDSVLQPTVLNANVEPWVVDSHQIHNLYTQYSVNDLFGGESTTFRIGARNLTDQDPPLASGGYLGNIHQPVGRYWYASVRQSF